MKRLYRLLILKMIRTVFGNKKGRIIFKKLSKGLVFPLFTLSLVSCAKPEGGSNAIKPPWTKPADPTPEPSSDLSQNEAVYSGLNHLTGVYQAKAIGCTYDGISLTPDSDLLQVEIAIVQKQMSPEAQKPIREKTAQTQSEITEIRQRKTWKRLIPFEQWQIQDQILRWLFCPNQNNHCSERRISRNTQDEIIYSTLQAFGTSDNPHLRICEYLLELKKDLNSTPLGRFNF